LETTSSACTVSNAIIAANSTHIVVEDMPLEETGHSKQKHIPKKMPDALNRCLCGIVADSQLDGVLECKRLGCETQWVRKYSIQGKIKSLTYIPVSPMLHFIGNSSMKLNLQGV